MPFSPKHYPQKGDTISMNGRIFEILDMLSDAPTPDPYQHIAKAKVRDQQDRQVYFLKFACVYDRDCVGKDNHIHSQQTLALLRRESGFRFFYPYLEKIYEGGEGKWNGDRIFGIKAQYIEGENLSDYLRSQVDPLANPELEKQSYKQIMQFLSAVNYYAGFADDAAIHRDIKPENIMIDKNGDAILVDFNFSHAPGSGSTVNLGVPIGATPGYGDPVTYGSSITDQQSDIYSAGRLIFFWLNASAYFTPEECEYDDHSAPKYASNPRIGYSCDIRRFEKKYQAAEYAELRRILEKMTAVRGQRYDQISQVIADLKRFLRQKYGADYRQELGLDQFPLLTGQERSGSGRRYVDLICQVDESDAKTVRLEENTVTDIQVAKNTVMLVYCHDNQTYCVPLTGQLVRETGSGSLLSGSAVFSFRGHSILLRVIKERRKYQRRTKGS